MTHPLTYRLLIPLDGSVCGEHALREGVALARRLNAEVTLLHVLHPEQSRVPRPAEPPGPLDARAARRMLTQAAETAYIEGVVAQTRLVEDPRVHPVEAILEAEAAHDLTVLATHGRRGLEHLVLGSVTEAVLRRSDKPHLVVNGALARRRDNEQAKLPAAEPSPV